MCLFEGGSLLSQEFMTAQKKKEREKEKKKEKEAVYCLFNLHCLNVAKYSEVL